MNKSFFKTIKISSVLPLVITGVIGGAVSTTLASLPNHKNENATEISQVTYNTQTSTTEAVKTIQNAVVSVLNYQNNETAELSDFYTQFFGEDGSPLPSEKIETEGLILAGEGSGVIYKKSNKEAYVVTNNHVVSGAEKLEILLADGSKVVGELVGADTYSDLAVVKISAKNVTTIADFADSDSLNVGEPAIAIGSPLGSEYANSVTEGIVSSLSRTVTSKNENGEITSSNAIQTDAAINPGNSGGPLINIKGQVIGINSSKITASGNSLNNVSVEGMGFAIPSNDVVTIINQLEKTGHVERPALGIHMANLNSLPTASLEKLSLPSDITAGVVVMSIQTGMPADGKLEVYDVITNVDGEEITAISDLQSLLYKHQVGDSLKVTVVRDTKQKVIDIPLKKTTQDLQN